jgi:hypothetical protein
VNAWFALLALGLSAAMHLLGAWLGFTRSQPSTQVRVGRPTTRRVPDV